MARDPFGALGQAMSYSGALSRNLALGQQAKQRRQRMVAEGSLDPLEAAQSGMSAEWDPFFEALQQKEEETNAAGGNFRVNWSGFGKPSEDYMPRRGDSRVYGALGDYGDDRGGGLSFFDRESLKNKALNEASNDAAMRARERDMWQEQEWQQRQQQLINDANTTYQQQQLAQAFAAPTPDLSSQMSASTDEGGRTTIALRPDRPESERERILALAPPPMKRQYEAQFAAEDLAKRKMAAEEAKIQNTASASAGSSLSPEAVEDNARLWNQTGQMVTLARNDPDREKILNRAAELRAAEGGGSIASEKANYRADAGSLAPLQKQRDAVAAFERTAMKNIDVFLDTAGKVVDTGSPLANMVARNVSGKALGSPDQAAYDAARQVAITEIAKVVQNPNLSGVLSDQARHEVENFNEKGATLEQSVRVMRLLKRDMQNRTTEMDNQLAEIRGRISKSGGKAGGDDQGVEEWTRDASGKPVRKGKG